MNLVWKWVGVIEILVAAETNLVWKCTYMKKKRDMEKVLQ